MRGCHGKAPSYTPPTPDFFHCPRPFLLRAPPTTLNRTLLPSSSYSVYSSYLTTPRGSSYARWTPPPSGS